MKIKSINGPRVVRLPDGTILSLADLPDPDVGRWTPKRKAVLVQAIRYRLMSSAEAMLRYRISSDELQGWVAAHEGGGLDGLKQRTFRSRRSAALSDAGDRPQTEAGAEDRPETAPDEARTIRRQRRGCNAVGPRALLPERTMPG